jgi:hypothetical protein
MTFDVFRQLSPLMQLFAIWQRGTFLAERWEADGGVNLYHMSDEGRGFFVEVCVDKEGKRPFVFRSFVSSEPLEEYCHYVRLPEGWE